MGRHANTGNTVLHASCAAGHLDIVKFLLAAYGNLTSQFVHMYDDLPVNLLNFAGFTPLLLAAEIGTRLPVLYSLSDSR